MIVSQGIKKVARIYVTNGGGIDATAQEREVFQDTERKDDIFTRGRFVKEGGVTYPLNGDSYVVKEAP